MSRAIVEIDPDGRPFGVRIKCPGCGDLHVLPIVSGYGARWTWNGNIERPTFSPGARFRNGHYAEDRETSSPAGCYCTDADDARPWGCYRCHGFIRDGRIQFLADCTHALAGQTVDLPEIEDQP